MAEKKADPTKVTVIGLRLSFASLFEPDKRKQDNGEIKEQWKANFLAPKATRDELVASYMGKRMPLMKAIKAASAAAKEKKWGDEKNWPKMKRDRTFFRDGDEEDWDGYEGHDYISANAQLNERPQVVTNRKDAKGHWIEAEAGGKGAPYSGCYVNGTIQIWAQDNEHGKRVNARVKAVQFREDGDPFGNSAPVNVDDEFDDDMVGEEGEIGEDFEEDDADDMV